MKRTYQPNKRKRSKTHGFRARMATVGGSLICLRKIHFTVGFFSKKL